MRARILRSSKDRSHRKTSSPTRNFLLKNAFRGYFQPEIWERSVEINRCFVLLQSLVALIFASNCWSGINIIVWKRGLDEKKQTLGPIMGVWWHPTLLLININKLSLRICFIDGYQHTITAKLTSSSDLNVSIAEFLSNHYAKKCKSRKLLISAC